MSMKVKTILWGCLILMLLASCSGAKLSLANEQFERGEYYDAAMTYRKVYGKANPRKERTLRGEVAFKMAECYRLINMAARSTAAYKNAIRYNYPDSMATFYLARSQHYEGKYKDAIKNYEAFLELNPKSQLAKNGMRGCNLAQEWKKNPTRYEVKKMTLFNSRRSDFAPMYLGAELDQVYFSSTTEKALGKNKSGITGTKGSDIFFAKKDERGAWLRPEPLEGDVNTEEDEGIVSFSPDGATMYLTKARREPNSDTSVEIYTSTRTGAQWSAPQKYEITSDTLSAFGHPAVSPDGEYLYFASDMPGGYGGKDIWRISITRPEGSLENLGVQINTAGNEMFPYIRGNGELYFASDGHPGMGGLDIFKAHMSTDGVWQIENMQYPINSAGDDFGITFGNEESGFFTSNRNDGRGYDKIFSFVLPSISVWISGYVIDKDDEPVPDAIIRIVGNDGSNQKEVARKDGSFRFKLDRAVHYVMLASCRGYLNSKQEFVSGEEEENAEYNVNFVLSSISKPILIENIFYDFDRATLRPESEASLDELVQLLNDNPNVSIELGAHTDLKGSDEYNLRLSDRRAHSVVDYLIKSGIDPDRLQAKGYGESAPKVITKKMATQYPQFKEGDILNEEFINTLSPEDQEIANQINRRTEFQVLSITWNLY